VPQDRHVLIPLCLRWCQRYRVVAYALKCLYIWLIFEVFQLYIQYSAPLLAKFSFQVSLTDTMYCAVAQHYCITLAQIRQTRNILKLTLNLHFPSSVTQ